MYRNILIYHCQTQDDSNNKAFFLKIFYFKKFLPIYFLSNIIYVIFLIVESLLISFTASQISQNHVTLFRILYSKYCSIEITSSKKSESGPEHLQNIFHKEIGLLNTRMGLWMRKTSRVSKVAIQFRRIQSVPCNMPFLRDKKNVSHFFRSSMHQHMSLTV